MVLKNSSIPVSFRKVKTCGPCRVDQYSSAKPVSCIDPLFSEKPSFQLLLKMKNYSRGNSFLPKQPLSKRFIPENLSYMGKDIIKAACQVSYSSYFPGIPRPLLIHTALAIIKIPCVYLSANQTSGTWLSIHNCASTEMPGWWALQAGAPPQSLLMTVLQSKCKQSHALNAYTTANVFNPTQ